MESQDPKNDPPAGVSAGEGVKGEAAEPKERSRAAKLWGQLRWRAHCLYPNVFPYPHARDDGARDQAKNEGSRIGLDLELRCSMVWGVELYGPDEIHNLYAGLERLDWSGITSKAPENAASLRVRQMRARGAGGWMNIGNVCRRGERTWSLASNFAPLPDGIEYLDVGVFQITPSTTALLIGFALDTAHANGYEKELNKDRKTITKRGPGRWTIQWLDVIHQKQDAIAKVRRDHRQIVGNWFSRHVPGYFSATPSPSHFPTMELLTGNGLELKEPQAPTAGSYDRWHRLLTQKVSREVWSISKYPGLQLASEEPHDEDAGLHLLVSLDTEKFPPDATRHMGGSMPGAYAFFSTQLLGGTLAYWATIEYLASQVQNIHRIREQLKVARSARRHVSATLDQIGAFFDQTLGSPAIARELAKHSEDKGWYEYRCADFTAEPWREGEKPAELPGSIRARVSQLSNQLAEEEALLRGQFEQLASILSVRESIRAQKWMFALTILAVLIAAASFVATIPENSAFLNWISTLTR